MAYVLADRVKETTTSTGTGNLTLAGAVAGFRAFSSVMSSGDCFTYAVVNSTGTQWEVGLGTLSGSNVLVRGTLFSSSTGSTINFSAGSKDVFITQSGANQFDVFQDYQVAVQTPADTGNGYMLREYQVPNLSGNPSGDAKISHRVLSTGSVSEISASLTSLVTSKTRTIYSDAVAAGDDPVASTRSYTGTASGDWNWTGSPEPITLSGMYFDGSATNGVTPNSYYTAHQFWQAYNGTPSFNYWDDPLSTFLPVTVGEIMVGDGATVPKWYRRTTTGWEPFGVATINVGAGMYLTGGATTGEVTINLGSPPPGWYSYVNATAAPTPYLLPMPPDFDVNNTLIYWEVSYQSVNPQPGTAWQYIGIYNVGTVFLGPGSPPWVNVVDPVDMANFFTDFEAKIFAVTPSAYGNTNVYGPYYVSSEYSNFGTSIQAGGWPVFGSSQNGFGWAVIQSGDYTGSLTGVNATITESYYDSNQNRTFVYFEGTAAQVVLWSGSNPIIQWTGAASFTTQFWYTYS